MPANWLKGIANLYGIKPARKRKENEKLIIEYLNQQDTIKTIFLEKMQKHVDLLYYLLTKGGFAELKVITSKYGPMDNDGFYWNDRPLCSTLGYLWSMGLVMVGRTKINGLYSSYKF